MYAAESTSCTPVKRVFDQDPALDFDGFVRALPGVHPDDVGRVLGSLQVSGQRKSPQRTQGLYVESLRGLPTPHPLDYDWRFSTATVTELAGRASVLIPRCGAIVLLGVPSLFGELRERRPDARLMLADTSAHSVEAVASIFKSEQLIVCDLLSASLPSISADVVIADLTGIEPVTSSMPCRKENPTFQLPHKWDRRESKIK